MKATDRFVGSLDEIEILDEAEVVEEEVEEVVEETMNFPQCVVCEHLISADKQTCEAYPKGIPDKFFFGDVMHDESTGDDYGIVFEAIAEILAKES